MWINEELGLGLCSPAAWPQSRASGPRKGVGWLRHGTADRGWGGRRVGAPHNASSGTPRWTTESTTAVIAAAGMGGGALQAWVRRDPSEAEVLAVVALDAVQVALELGVDLNASDVAAAPPWRTCGMARKRTVGAWVEWRGARPGEGR